MHKYFLTTRLLLNLLFIIGFTASFGYGPEITLLNSLLIAAIYIVVGYAIGLFLFFSWPSQYLRSKFAAIILVMVDFMIILIYFANVASNLIWRSNITYSMISDYVSAWRSMISNFPIIVPVSLIVLFAFALLVKNYYRNAFQIKNSIIKCFSTQQSRHKPFVNRKAIYSLFFVPVVAYVVSDSFIMQDRGHWTGEPITSFGLEYIPSGKLGNIMANVEYSASEYSSDRKNIVVIVSDSLRADHLQVYGYHRNTSPFINRLVDENVLLKIENVYASCPESVCGIMSILSSKEYAKHFLSSRNLGDVLKLNGYKTHYLLTGAHGWGGLKQFYRADIFSDGSSRNKFSVNDDLGVLDDLLKLELTEGQPNFLYIHLYSTHGLGAKHRQFNTYKPYREGFGIYTMLFEKDEDYQIRKINEYDNRIIQADYIISQIFEILKQKKMLKNSLVYLTSDHGEGLGEHGDYGHLHNLYEGNIKIPLLIYDENSTIYKNTNSAVQIDIAPTILSRIGIAIPDDWQGVSLLEDEPSTRVTRHQVNSESSWKAVIKWDKENAERYKYMWKGISWDERAEEELFDLKIDPGESNDLSPAGHASGTLSAEMYKHAKAFNLN